MQVFTHRPRNRDTVIRARSSANLVEQYKASRGGGVQDGAGLCHLHHERRLAADEVVARTDTREYTIAYANGRRRSGHKATCLCHEHDEPNLSQDGALARHVRTGEY